MSIVRNLLAPTINQHAAAAMKTENSAEMARSPFATILQRSTTAKELEFFIEKSRVMQAKQALFTGDLTPSETLPLLNTEAFSPIVPALQPLPQPTANLEEGPKQEPVTRERMPTSYAVGGATSYENIIAYTSSKVGLSPDLIRAVIKTESNFNQFAVSPAGAKGLMQLMPGTAKELGVTDVFDAKQNIQAGARFLKDMLNRYDGDLDKALAAYNWGPGNVDKGKPLPKETREYLAKVKGELNRYMG